MKSEFNHLQHNSNDIPLTALIFSEVVSGRSLVGSSPRGLLPLPFKMLLLWNGSRLKISRQFTDVGQGLDRLEVGNVTPHFSLKRFPMERGNFCCCCCWRRCCCFFFSSSTVFKAPSSPLSSTLFIPTKSPLVRQGSTGSGRKLMVLVGWEPEKPKHRISLS